MNNLQIELKRQKGKTYHELTKTGEHLKIGGVFYRIYQCELCCELFITGDEKLIRIKENSKECKDY